MSSNPLSALQTILERLGNLADLETFVNGVREDPQTVLEAMRLLNGRNQTLSLTNEELERAQIRIAELEQLSASQNSTNESSRSQISLLAQAIRDTQIPLKSVSIPDPAVFKGSKRDFFTWMDSILLKLNVNSDHFPTEQTKMAYIYFRLDAPCQAHLHSWVKNGTILFTSLNQMMELLKTLFDDPNRIRDAICRLYSNHQQNKPFSTWIAEIRRDASMAGYDSQYRTLRDLVLNNMSSELKKAIIHERDIDLLSFDQTVSRLQDIDSRQRASTGLFPMSNNREAPLSSTGSSSAYTTVPSTPPRDSMDLSSVSLRPRGPLSKEEKMRRRNLGLCIYCGRSGHMIRNCSFKPSLDKSDTKAYNVGQEVAGGAGKV